MEEYRNILGKRNTQNSGHMQDATLSSFPTQLEPGWDVTAILHGTLHKEEEMSLSESRYDILLTTPLRIASSPGSCKLVVG